MSIKIWPDSLIEWIATSAIDVNHPAAWIELLIERMIQTGLPLARVKISHQILHPQLAGISYCWTDSRQEIEIIKSTQGLLERDAYLSSPLYPVCEGKTNKVRCPLYKLQAPFDYPILNNLKADGITDYLVLPLNFSGGRIGAIIFATRKTNGFSDPQIVYLQEITHAVTRGIEILILNETALSLLNAYLGKTAGKRVLSGVVQQGKGETIKAIIWFSDLRASTRLSETLSPDHYLTLLNQYFECLAGSVLQQGGEVLRFIGDAVLAIFPIGDHNFKTWNSACEAALCAVREADNEVNKLNQSRQKAKLPTIEYGVALHVGEVHYGNIGTSERVEFTVIGKAANEAAKIESLCKVLCKKVILSENFTLYHDGAWQYLGQHILPGSQQKVNLYSIDLT
ncbi:adenylate/guanylate cyclase domain-containing protein [Zooshikella ganghwensis]|uniref:Adenylate/guanylate cyclase domain-containing protein n=2 Tax=Zooshikella ganghwensis TaxID=202772 RepID=A0A4P9VMP3_9GAMM|nr:adenylate/guanylate cyclase domain-containing protein [Zooshikella ganghwensis]